MRNSYLGLEKHRERTSAQVREQGKRREVQQM